MVNGVFNFFLRSGNFRFQSSYPLLQLIDGKWVEVLPHKGGKGIISLSRQIFVHVHDGNVDRPLASVNKVPCRFVSTTSGAKEEPQYAANTRNSRQHDGHRL